MSERSIRELYKKISELKIATVYIKERNKRLNADFGEPYEGGDPPDAISENGKGRKLSMEVVKFDPEFWGTLLKTGSHSGDVDRLQSLMETLKVKAAKEYDPKFRSKLVLLLQGNMLGDDYFEKYEKAFIEIPSNRRALERLGFKEIWYVSTKKERAFPIYVRE